MRNILLSVALIFMFSACSKENKEFTLKTIKLNAYRHPDTVNENVYVKLFETGNDKDVLAVTNSYPSSLPLPVSFAVSQPSSLKLYKDQYTIELWGDVSGLIGSTEIDMNEYKIVFPIDMETKSGDISISIMGSWR